MSSASATGQFYVSNGEIIDPEGNDFIAHGIDLGPNNMTEATPQVLESLFPGINFVRFATTYDSSYSLASQEAYIDSLTAAGIVVEIEDHPYPSPGTYTGDQLAAESAWYSQLATLYKNNPYVWFGTMNEPNSGTYGASEAAITTQEVATYDAIRATGNNTMIMMELDGGGNPGTVGANFGMTASAYSTMTNIAWDLHFYGWSSNYSTDQATVTANLLGSVSGGYGIAAAQSITSANGIVPVIVGEFGDSTTGATTDPNGTQVIDAVLNSGYGYAAWTFGGQGGPDELTDNGVLTTFGQEVAAAIAAGAAPPSPPVAASVSDTVVLSGSTASITDSAGNKWTISSGAVDENGAAAGYTANVKEIAYVSGTVWQENTSNLWWGWSGTGWTLGNGTSTSPLPAPPAAASANDTVVAAGSTSAIVDATGNSWTISSGAVDENGAAAGYTANVKEIAYVSGTVWQENTSNLWWGWSGTGWTLGNGTVINPMTSTSANDQVVYAGAGNAIGDSSHDLWTITNGVVEENGTAAGSSANVTEIAYVNGNIWEENASNVWSEWSNGAWTGSTTTSPLPAPIDIASTETSATISVSEMSVVATAGNHMVFINGHADSIELSGGANTITENSKYNTYFLPQAGNGTDTFTSNVLADSDWLDLRPALSATNWNGASSTLANYIKVTDTAQGATIGISLTSGGSTVGIATIAGATTTSLTTLLQHAVT